MLTNKFLARVIGLAFLLTAVSVGTGCGGSSDQSSPEAAQPLTKAQFVKQANSLCRRQADRKERLLASSLQKQGKQTVLDASPHEIEDLAVQVVFPLYEELLARLEDLGQPSSDGAGVKTVIAEWQSALDEAEAEPAILFTQRPFEKANEAAGRYGLRDCALY